MGGHLRAAAWLHLFAGYTHSTQGVRHTISILRTEVIDGETYYVFSDISTTMPEGMLTGGSKMRAGKTALQVARQGCKFLEG